MTDAQMESLAPLFIGGVFSLIGLIFLTIGVLRRRMTRTWSRTTGIVVNQRDGSTTGMTARSPTFRWRDQHGTDHQRTSMVYSSLGPAPGTSVPVLFDPDNPSRAVMDTMAQSGRLFVGIGAGLIGFGILVGLALGATVIFGP